MSAFEEAERPDDPQINSPFGCYDGNVYERYFARVKTSNPHNPVPPCVSRPLVARSVARS